MTSIWNQLDIETKVLTILRSIPRAGGPDAYGHPFISAYHLAIELEIRFPELRRELNVPVGGAGNGQPNSLAQYLAQQLAGQIGRRGAHYPIEEAGFSPIRLVDIRVPLPNGDVIRSSNTEAGYDLSLFRLRDI